MPVTLRCKCNLKAKARKDADKNNKQSLQPDDMMHSDEQKNKHTDLMNLYIDSEQRNKQWRHKSHDSTMDMEDKDAEDMLDGGAEDADKDPTLTEEDVDPDMEQNNPQI